MQFYKCALLCAILAISILDPITARKSYSGGGGRHSYPKSGGLSGGGGGGSHGYPSSGGLSGSGSHYPSSGGSHGYPSPGGSHGYPSSGGSHGYPSGGLSGNSGGKPYPSSGGNHGYPGSNGLSGSGNNRGSGSTTNIHNHYHYTPPQSITYTPTRGGPQVSYPVYRGQPPTYVYQYKDSGSKYGTLLAGLALLNLGTLAAGTAYAVSHSNSHGGGSSSYTKLPGEICKFGVKKDNGDYEETRIDCQLISSFILAEQVKTQAAQQNSTTITTSTTVTNITTVNNTNPVDSAAANQTTKVLYEMLPNGTLVPVNVPVNSTNDTAAASNPMTSVVTTTMTNTTVTNALDVKGKPVEVTPGMQCFVIRTVPNSSTMRKTVPCQVLQTYADKSIKPNSATRSLPTFLILTSIFALFIVN